jgi:hypothetical protein
VKIASTLGQNQVTNWFILFEALARASENDLDSVRRTCHAAMIQITAEMEVLNDDIMKNAFDEALPQFFSANSLAENDLKYYVSAAEFQEMLFSRLLEPNWGQLNKFFADIITIIGSNVVRQNDDFTKASLKVLWAFITPKDRELSDEHKGVLFAQLLRIANQLYQFSIENGHEFLNCLAILQSESNNEPRFLEVFETAIEACEGKKHFILWADARATTLEVMLRYGEELTESIAGCFETTIRNFLGTEFPYNITTANAMAWNQAIIASMEVVNAMPKQMFEICFRKAQDGLLSMISATNIEVRKQINVAMQKRLL